MNKQLEETIMSLKTGPQAYEFEAGQKYSILAESDFSIFKVDSDGQLEQFYLRSHKGQAIFRVRKSFNGYVKLPKTHHWSMDIVDLPSPYEKAGPVPLEVPESVKTPPTLEEKMKQLLAGMIAERYGEDSKEMETFEESMDFDMEEDSNPLSGYEVQDMDEEYLDDRVESPPVDQPDQQQKEEPEQAEQKSKETPDG